MKGGPRISADGDRLVKKGECSFLMGVGSFIRGNNILSFQWVFDEAFRG